MATLTIRLIKSFEYRTTKNLILRDVDLNWKVSELKQLILSKLSNEAGFRPFINVQFDTLKLYVKAHGTKSQNLIINIDDEGYMDDDETLAALGVENETEISFFAHKDYEAFKLNPEIKW